MITSYWRHKPEYIHARVCKLCNKSHGLNLAEICVDLDCQNEIPLHTYAAHTRPSKSDMPVINTTQDSHFGYTRLKRDEKLMRQYSVTSRAWYSDAVLNPKRDRIVDEINIGHYSSAGGTTGEFTIKAVDLGQSQIAIQVCVFDDAFHLFHYESSLFERISKLGSTTTLSDVEDVLKTEGFEDRTVVDDPYLTTSREIKRRRER